MEGLETEFGEGRVGFVTIVGRPNVGKSTLLNEVLSYHLTAVSNRPNTTRKRWLGILSDAHSQIIFADTPGVHSAGSRMQEAMARTIRNEIERNDAVLCLCDATRAFGEEDRRVAEIVREGGKPVVLAVNKLDAASESQAREIADEYRAVLGENPVFNISALKSEGVSPLLDYIRQMLPRGLSSTRAIS